MLKLHHCPKRHHPDVPLLRFNPLLHYNHWLKLHIRITSVGFIHSYFWLKMNDTTKSHMPDQVYESSILLFIHFMNIIFLVVFLQTWIKTAFANTDAWPKPRAFKYRTTKIFFAVLIVSQLVGIILTMIDLTQTSVS